MTPSLSLLIVEDQADLAANLWDYFSRRGHVIDHASDGETGLRMALAGGHDVIVLDLGLPRMDGLVLCRRLREAGKGVPVLMLTARDTLEDKLKGFAEGADDYLVKPFAMRELEARIGVLARNGRRVSNVLEFAGLEFVPDELVARRDGATIPLTVTQARVMECLMRHAPAIVDHGRLMRAIWGPEGGDMQALHSHLYALRQAIDRPFERALIHNVHGVGYRFGESA